MMRNILMLIIGLACGWLINGVSVSAHDICQERLVTIRTAPIRAGEFYSPFSPAKPWTELMRFTMPGGEDVGMEMFPVVTLPKNVYLHLRIEPVGRRASTTPLTPLMPIR